ncbi:sulfite exporter TauE/SafE family protein [Lentisphaerota bacterium WC36G]|nr:sulfite exporter TauE/SafE family protein [Lentisphaerae bacterium WC36]
MEESASFLALCSLAIFLGVTHTAAGPDHYVPFIALSNARNWNRKKTLLITFVCGLGHVLSSIVIGAIGLLISTSITKLKFIEGFRGDIAAWLLTICGAVYLLWAIYSLKKKHHHNNKDIANRKNLTFWSLFIIFVFGPCEPLIPMLMFPAATIGILPTLIVALLFCIATLSVMMLFVFLGTYSQDLLKKFDFHRYSHILAGLMVTMCGVAVLAGL